MICSHFFLVNKLLIRGCSVRSICFSLALFLYVSQSPRVVEVTLNGGSRLEGALMYHLEEEILLISSVDKISQHCTPTKYRHLPPSELLNTHTHTSSTICVLEITESTKLSIICWDVCVLSIWCARELYQCAQSAFERGPPIENRDELTSSLCGIV